MYNYFSFKAGVFKQHIDIYFEEINHARWNLELAR